LGQSSLRFFWVKAVYGSFGSKQFTVIYNIKNSSAVAYGPKAVYVSPFLCARLFCVVLVTLACVRIKKALFVVRAGCAVYVFIVGLSLSDPVIFTCTTTVVPDVSRNVTVAFPGDVGVMVVFPASTAIIACMMFLAEREFSSCVAHTSPAMSFAEGLADMSAVADMYPSAVSVSVTEKGTVTLANMLASVSAMQLTRVVMESDPERYPSAVIEGGGIVIVAVCSAES
jgi:hypothetical protein